MNKITNKFLLTGDRFMSELNLRQPWFAYSTCGLFTKHCEKIKKFRETGNLKHIYTNELRTITDEVSKNRAYEIAINPKYNRYQRRSASMIYMIFDKLTRSGLGASVIES